MASKKTNVSIGMLCLKLAGTVFAVVLLSTVFWNAVEKAKPAPTVAPETTTVPPVMEDVPPEVPEDTTPALVISPDAKGMDAITAYANYNGLSLESYGDEDMLKILANAYDTMPDLRQFVLTYAEEKDKEHPVDMSEFQNADGIPTFFQWDSRWGYTPYGKSVGAISGGGPTCLAMVAWYYFQDADMTPDKMMIFAEENGYDSADGTSWKLFTQGAEKLGLEAQELALVKKRVVDKVEAGIPVVLNVGPGLFSDSGNYVLLTGYKNGRFQCVDPDSASMTQRGCTWEEIQEEIRNLWAISLPTEEEPVNG